MSSMAPAAKSVIWMGDALEMIREFPASVQDEVGYALYLAQIGSKHVSAKPLKGFGSGTLEVLSDHRGDTFRAVYTVRFEDAVYVLHAFQKKARRGIKTPQRELDLIGARLKQAEEIHHRRERQ